MMPKYKFVLYTGEQVNQNINLLADMNAISFEYDFLKEKDVLQYLDESSIVYCMTKNDELIGFSWVVMSEEEQISELCWFVMDKHKTKGLEGKLLLDKTLEYCKNHNITYVKFNCDSQSWGKIKNKTKLLSKYGYKIDTEEKDYDVSISI